MNTKIIFCHILLLLLRAFVSMRVPNTAFRAKNVGRLAAGEIPSESHLDITYGLNLLMAPDSLLKLFD